MQDLESNISATDVQLLSTLMQNTEAMNAEEASEILKPLIGVPQRRQPQRSQAIIEELSDSDLDEELSDNEDKFNDTKYDLPNNPSSTPKQHFTNTFDSKSIFNTEDFNDIDVTAENSDIRIRREKQEILLNTTKY